MPRKDARARLVVERLEAQEREHLACAVALLPLLDHGAKQLQGAEQLATRGVVDAPDLYVVDEAAFGLG